MEKAYQAWIAQLKWEGKTLYQPKGTQVYAPEKAIVTQQVASKWKASENQNGLRHDWPEH